MKVAGPIDTHADIDLRLGKEGAPRMIDQRSISLKGVRHGQVGGLQPID
jgi:hypothetical protein